MPGFFLPSSCAGPLLEQLPWPSTALSKAPQGGMQHHAYLLLQLVPVKGQDVEAGQGRGSSAEGETRALINARRGASDYGLESPRMSSCSGSPRDL